MTLIPLLLALLLLVTCADKGTGRRKKEAPPAQKPFLYKQPPLPEIVVHGCSVCQTTKAILFTQVTNCRITMIIDQTPECERLSKRVADMSRAGVQIRQYNDPELKRLAEAIDTPMVHCRYGARCIPVNDGYWLTPMINNVEDQVTTMPLCAEDRGDSISGEKSGQKEIDDMWQMGDL